MPIFDDEAGDDSDIVFRDLILLMLTGFVTVAVLMLAHINPKAASANVKDTAPPGNVMVEANWPPGMDSDSTLVQHRTCRGYSNKCGAVFKLLRDDLDYQLYSPAQLREQLLPAWCRASTRSTSISTATGLPPSTCR